MKKFKQSQRQFLDCYADQIERLYGRRPRSFVCPFLRRDISEPELCGGHVLPKSIRASAPGDISRLTVPQVAAFDRHFGATLELDFAPMASVMSGAVTLEQLAQPKLARSDEPGCDTTFPVYASNRAEFEAGPTDDIYPVEMLNDHPRRYLRVYAPGQTSLVGKWVRDQTIVIDFEAKMLNPDSPASQAVWVRSAWMALFHACPMLVFGNNCFEDVAGPFSRFYLDKAGVDDAEKYFGGFVNAARQLRLEPDPPVIRALDTLRHGTLLIHTAGGAFGDEGGFPFAAGAVFRLGGGDSIVVSVPWGVAPERREAAMEQYDRYLADPDLPAHHLSAIETDMNARITVVHLTGRSAGNAFGGRLGWGRDSGTVWFTE